jgi:Uma2 family endonuclease
MTIAKEPDSPVRISEDIVLPTEEIYSNEPPLETYLHLYQIFLLMNSLQRLWKDRQDFFVAGNLSIYYSPLQIKSQDFRGPDVFVVLNTDSRPRKSWVIWQENYQYPNVIVEVLSPSTAKVDKTTKKSLYQNTFCTPEYFWFNPYNNLDFKGFRLQNRKYRPIKPNTQGYLWSQELGLYLGLYEGLVRYFTPEGQLVPTSNEQADREAFLREQAEQKAAIAEQRANQEAILREQFQQEAAIAEQRANQEAILREQFQQEAAIAKQQVAQEVLEKERLAAKLRELNIDVDSM